MKSRNFFLLLDRDGTLFSTCKLNQMSYNHALSYLKLNSIQLKTSDFCQGGGINQIFNTNRLVFSPNELSQIKYFKNIYFRENLNLAHLNHDLLDFVNTNNLKWAIVSNSSRQSTLDLLDYFAIDNCLFVLGSENVLSLKPSPDLYLEAKKLIFNKWNSNEIFALEDSQIGLASFVSAGINGFQLKHFCS